MRPKPNVSPFGGARRASLLALGAVLFVLGCSSHSAASAPRPGAQLAFGAQMAQRGLWAEARFRFEQVAKLDPSNARALANLAVSLEALGRFDEARATYERALKLEPGNVEIKRNQARFEEFYTSFKGGRVKETKAPAEPAEPGKKGEKG